MKKTTFGPLILGVFLLTCCAEKQKNHSQRTDGTIELIVPEIIAAKSDLTYDHKTSLWLQNGLPFSGSAVSYYPDNSLKEKIGIANGKKQNETIQWYEDGHYKNISSYHEGKLHGDKKVWSQDSAHILIAHYTFQNGKAHGEQKKWYPTGELFKVLHLNMGKEEGLQQAFRTNGDLYANYEARNGRIFGLKKSTLCYSLEDEEIKLIE
ncbi:membrane-binding protein [Algoriphagus sp. SE2]|uniref:toxin-antitoxin system YwqK family antitoxin n=1 Tax=Algoriphagus sp. SE2 TaxID=3141536 RepID=UPI0031CDA7E7